MAIFGRLDNLKKQFESFNEFDAVLDYLKQAVSSNTEVNMCIRSMSRDQYKKIEITDDIFAIEQSYDTHQLEGSLFESHIKYVDVQFLILGEEVIGGCIH